MKKITLIFVLLIMFVIQQSVFSSDYEPDDKIIYKESGDSTLELHIFKPEGPKSTDKRSCIIFFFGGGWKKGTPSQFYPLCRYLASRGMVAISAEYRVESRDGTSPYECVRDGKSAIRWIREHADLLGVDPNRIAAGGGSAGGHVAAATGTVQGFEESSENLKISSRPDALVLFNPVFDNGPEGYGYDRVKEHWKEFSPMHNIQTKTPATIVFLGTNDELIPVSTAEKYKEIMKNAGIPCDLHLYSDQGHGFFNYRDGKNSYYNQTVIAADRFLASLGFLDGEPTLKDLSKKSKQ